MARESKLAALDAAITRGLADADSGRLSEIEEVRAEIQRHYSDAEAAKFAP